MIAEGTLYSVENWVLAPEGAIVHPLEKLAVIADVHLGYEWARGKAGDSIPAHSLGETVERLGSLLRRFPESIATLIVAGDLVESSRPCRRTADDLGHLKLWLDLQGIELVLLRGNHDPAISKGCEHLFKFESVREVDGWTIGHGHLPLPGSKTISGHIHPIFRFEGLSAPCFLVQRKAVLLPAFSRNAAGLDVLSRRVASQFRGESPRCLVSTGEEILDFGTLSELAARTLETRTIPQGQRR